MNKEDFMETEVRIYPNNFNATAKDKIEKLEIGISILKEHINQFGVQISSDYPKAYSFLISEIANMERELNIRKSFPIHNLKKEVIVK